MTRAALLWILSLLALAGAAQAHPGHVRPGGLYLALKVEAGQVRGGLNLPEAVVRRLVTPPIGLGRAPSAADQARLRDAALGVLRATALRVDGQPAEPVVDRVDAIVRVPPVALRAVQAIDGLHLNPGPYPALQVRFHLNANEIKRLGARWGRPELLGGEDPAVGATVVVGEQAEPFHMSAEEPAFEWHAPFRGARPQVTLAPAPAPRPRLPIALTLLVLLGLGATWRLRGNGRLVALAVTGLVAVGAQGWRPLDVPAPWGDGGRPGAEQALVIHADLLRQAYRAFEHKDDAAAYDALAQAVDGPLLEWLYGQLYEGLVLREEGGAVAQVKAVDVLSAAVGPPPGDDPSDASFRVDARWQVVGEVSHYGHTHRRTQRYTGTFTVAPRAGGWRIVDLALGDQERVDTQPADGLLQAPAAQ